VSTTQLSGRTPAARRAAAAPGAEIASSKAARLGASTISPTRFDASGSTNVRAVMPRGPNTS
jgi:hypothetical protein